MVADDQQPEWLEHLSVLRLEPGDVVVVRSPYRITVEQATRIHEQVTAILGGEHKVMVLENDMDIGVVRGGSDA